jgi:hypothetical protein
MVNMGRGLGTALGVAAVTLMLHVVPGMPGERAAAAVLLAFGVLMIPAGRVGGKPGGKPGRRLVGEPGARPV